MLIDIHGRVAIDLRVSLTDVGSNLRRTYRMRTCPFCRACDRTRLSAAGRYTCLFAREESDLRGALRSGVPDEDIAGLEARDAGKRAGSGLDEPSFLQPGRPMSAGGG